MISGIAKAAADELWGFLPGRDIKIVHLTNGLLRAISGGHPKLPRLLGDVAATHAGRERLKETTRRSAAQLLDDDRLQDILLGDSVPALLDELRVALDAVLNQDGAFYAGSTSTPTLTHWRHLTTDPSDNEAGALIASILLADPNQAAAVALRKALNDNSDATYQLTQPLLPTGQEPMPALPPVSEIGNMLEKSETLRSLQQAFGRLAAHSERLGKLELLARAGRLAGLGLWMHMLNAGGGVRRQPLLVCGPDEHLRDVRMTSHRGLALAQRQLRRHFREALYAQLQAGGRAELTADDYRAWVNEVHPNHRERFLLELEQQLEAGLEPGWAVSGALVTPALLAIRGESYGADKLVKDLGRRLGLWPRYSGRTGHHLKPVAAIYDALVPALLSPGETMRYREFWQRAADEFGLVCGARGSTDMEVLKKAGMSGLTPAQLAQNAHSVLRELSRQGYARTYADGEALIIA